MKNSCLSKVKRMFMMCLLVGVFMSSQAQNSVQDSLGNAAYSVDWDRTHRLKLREVLIPIALVGISALYVGSDWFVAQKESVQDFLSAQGKNRVKVDDYLQYTPMAAVYGLNLLGVKGEHAFKDRTIILAMSYVTMGVAVNAMKFVIKEKRPDSDACNSFPSGHTATVFMGAEFLYREYKDVSPWIGYAGYAVAATTGYLRIYNNRHYFNDVVAGACIGILSTKLAYWLYPKCFKRAECNDRITFLGAPYYSAGNVGINMAVVF